jgi:hypothetical protein
VYITKETMNLAPPAPLTEPAIAEPAQIVEAAIADGAPMCEAADARPPPPVQPATTEDGTRTGTANNINPATSPVSVQSLRKTGFDFESYAGVLLLDRLPTNKILRVCLPCLMPGRRSMPYGEVKKYVFIKNGICLVYAEQYDPTPLYSLLLDEVEILPEDHRPFVNSVSIDPLPKQRNNPNFKTILLKPAQEVSQVYQFSFYSTEAGKDAAKRFVDVVERAPHVLTATALTLLDNADRAMKNSKGSL